MENPFSAIPPGHWHAELNLDPSIPSSKSMRYTKGEPDNTLPFTFEVKYENADKFFLEIKNGEEVIKVEDVSFGHNSETGKDSVIINFPIYNTYICAYFEEDVLEGRWFVPGKGNYSIPFLAKHGTKERFNLLSAQQKFSMEGKWEVLFGIEDEQNTYPAIGEFNQNEEAVTGTFMTETGDYRYLEGVVDNDVCWLSVFDGSHAFLFKAKLQEDGSLNGFFKSGKHYETLFSARKNDEASLIDPDSLTYLKEGFQTVDFAFPNINGDTIRLDDPQFEGKGKIIQILGTWCPNCRDETKFLVEYLNKTEVDVAVIGIAFERSEEFNLAKEHIDRYQKLMNVTYPILYGGPLNKTKASERFPMLDQIKSYPTLIFLNQNNEVVRIHTGFNGPATSEYDNFVESFEETVLQISS